MSEKSARAIEVFFSYSHKDEELRDELEKHLSILKRQGVITGWHDRKIGAGREWAGEIDTHLNIADVILLLISSDFLASDYCYDVEMKRAMERHEAGEARVVPVVLRPCDWKGAPFGKLQALPKDAKPVVNWPNLDQAFENVAQGVRAAVGELVSLSAGPPSSIGTAQVSLKVDKSKRRMIEGWIGKAWNQLRAAKDHLESFQYSESIEASQECVELSVKSILSLLEIEYPPGHGWNREKFSGIAKQIQERQLLDKLTAQGLYYGLRLPRLLLLANFWAQFYLPAKYGFEDGYLAPAQDLFKKQEAELAAQHADECYYAASEFRHLDEDKLAALLHK